MYGRYVEVAVWNTAFYRAVAAEWDIRYTRLKEKKIKNI